MSINLKSKIYVAGHRGMAGSAIIRTLNERGFNNIVTCTHSELDLVNQQQVHDFFKKEKPDQVYLAAAKVGGIQANSIYPAEFIYENLMIQSNVIHEAFLSGVKKLLFLGSSCVYPKLADLPITENALLSDYLEPTNEPYAIAKISGIKLCESYNRQYGKSHGIDYRSVMPTNMYGPGDNYSLDNGHVIPALLRKFHDAKVGKLPFVKIWGTGSPKREFLHADDFSEASFHVMNIEKDIFDKYTETMCSHINIGSGSDISIKELAELIKKITGYGGRIDFDLTKPDGTPRKIMDSSKLNSLGWRARISLKQGLISTYDGFIKQDSYRNN
jgi:GDP-L-fucose synthase